MEKEGGEGKSRGGKEGEGRTEGWKRKGERGRVEG